MRCRHSSTRGQEVYVKSCNTKTGKVGTADYRLTYKTGELAPLAS